MQNILRLHEDFANQIWSCENFAKGKGVAKFSQCCKGDAKFSQVKKEMRNFHKGKRSCENFASGCEIFQC